MVIRSICAELVQREEDPSGDYQFQHNWQRRRYVGCHHDQFLLDPKHSNHSQFSPLSTLFRYSSLQLSQRKLFRSAHRGGVTWLDLDHVEQRYLLSCASDASIAIYDTQLPTKDDITHEAVATITKPTPSAHQVAISSVAWYPIDNGIFLSGARDGHVKIWDANTLTVGGDFSIQAPVFAVSMSSAAVSHCLVAVGSSEPDVLLCDVTSGGFSHRLQGHRAGIWAVAWSPINEFELISGGRDGQLRIWDIRRAGTQAVLDMHDTKNRQAVGNGAAAAGQRLPPPPPAPRPQAPGAPTTATIYAKSHESGITGVIPTPDGLFWLSAGNDDRVRLWNTATHRHELVHYNDTFNRASNPRQIAVSDDGNALFHPSGSAVQVFDVHSGSTAATLAGGHFESVNCCLWNGVQEELYTGSNDHNIVVWAPKEAGMVDLGGEGDDQDAWSD
jgi:DNA excision repair protein ERCC-8